MKKKSSFSPLKIIGLLLLLCIIAVGASFIYVVYFDTSPVEIIELNHNSANVLSNSELAGNIPNSNISQEICAYTNNCTPVYKIGTGEDPVTVICAGVHGDQLVPSVAAMRLINYLDGRKINGTVYVIPFTSPKAISQNTKLTDGVNLNTVADESGSASNDVVKLALSSNASAVGDFHETEIGKNPGKTTIMCSQIPTYGSFQLAEDMSKLSLDTTMTYNVAGVAYDGAVEDVLNLNGTASVTPLVVVSGHGKVYSSAVDESYDQMLALLLVNHNLNPDDTYLKLANADMDGFNF
ncbi:MAG: succinylglutamate desuccinylase/aspartoacylase family protein [Methanosphaera sp.]|nr:succinylglutamate desuccinylase/aspartoacylase family protein [Methanosphaera sp.]